MSHHQPTFVYCYGPTHPKGLSSFIHTYSITLTQFFNFGGFLKLLALTDFEIGENFFLKITVLTASLNT